VNFDAIREALERALTSANASADEMLRQWEVPVETDRGANVYVVASIAGGTGSGMFLDTGFLCRTLGFGNAAAFLVTPGVFQQGQERMAANGYAALKELEHFSTNACPYEWKPGYPPHDVHPLKPPPFDYCYLLGSTNYDGKTIEFKTRDTLFEMVANSIFQDFAKSDFAAKKRSVRVNLDWHLTGIYANDMKDPQDPNRSVLTEAFTKRQSAFGLTSIQYPADRIRRALGAKLGNEIMTRFAQGKVPTGEFGAWVRENFCLNEVCMFIGATKVDGRPIHKNDILDSLYRTDQPGQTIVSVIDERINRLRNDVSGGAHRLKNMTITQFFRGQIEQLLVNIRDEHWEPSPDKWGDWCRWMRNNRDRFLREEIRGEGVGAARKPSRLETAIETIVNDPDKGISYARVLLKELRRTITDDAYPYLSTFQREATQLTADIRGHQKTYQEKLGELEKREQEGSLVRVVFGGAEIKQLSTDILAHLREYLTKVMQLRARSEAINICQEILKRIGDEGVVEEKTGRRSGESGLSAELIALHTHLTGLAAELNKLFQEYSKSSDDQNTLFIYDDDDLDQKYYPEFLGRDPVTRATKLTELAGKLLGTLPAADLSGQHGLKVMEIPAFVDLRGEDEAVKAIHAFGDSVFRGLQDKFEVVDLFFEKYLDSGAQTNQLRLLYSKAQEWIKPSQQTNFPMDTGQRVFMVGMYENPHNKNVERFKRLVYSVQKQGQPSIAIGNIDSKSEIIFYSEAAGYPLCFCDTVHAMKPKYETMAYSKFANLHADRNEYLFQDILEISEPDRESLEQSTRAFLLGVILRVVTPQKDEEGDIIFTISERVGLHTQPRSIGTEQRAVHTLVASEKLRSLVNEFITQREDELKRSADGWAKYYAIVSLYQRELYPQKKTTKASKEDLYEATTENVVLRRKLKEIETAAPSDVDAFEKQATAFLDDLANTATKLADKFPVVNHPWAQAAAVRL
jgi:hypothetical protein